MENSENVDEQIFVMQIASSVESGASLRWIANYARVIRDMGGISLVPGRVGRSEPNLRRAGARLFNEPLDDDIRRGAGKRLAELAKQHQPIAYIAHDLRALQISVKLQHSSDAPILFLVQNFIPKARFFGNGSLDSLKRHVTLFITPSQCLADHLMREHEIPTRNIQVIREGIDTQNICSDRVSQERAMSLADSWHAIEDPRDLIVTPAYYSDVKWRDAVLDFAAALETLPQNNLRLIVVGDDEGNGDMDKLDRQLQLHSPSAPVSFVGYCADIEAAVKLSSLVSVFPNQTAANFQIALIAQAMGRHLLMPESNPAAHEFLDAPYTGVLVADAGSNYLSAISNWLENADTKRASSNMAARIFIDREFSTASLNRGLAESLECLNHATS